MPPDAASLFEKLVAMMELGSTKVHLESMLPCLSSGPMMPKSLSAIVQVSLTWPVANILVSQTHLGQRMQETKSMGMGKKRVAGNGEHLHLMWKLFESSIGETRHQILAPMGKSVWKVVTHHHEPPARPSVECHEGSTDPVACHNLAVAMKAKEAMCAFSLTKISAHAT